MKSTGIVRNSDDLGRIVLPKPLRRDLGITPDTPLEIFIDGDAIVLRKYQPVGSCAFCGEFGLDTVLFQGKYVCADCRRALARL